MTLNIEAVLCDILSTKCKAAKYELFTTVDTELTTEQMFFI
jgi:hypothetical protein